MLLRQSATPSIDQLERPDNDQGSRNSAQDQAVPAELMQGRPELHGQSYPPEITSRRRESLKTVTQTSLMYNV